MVEFYFFWNTNASSFVVTLIFSPARQQLRRERVEQVFLNRAFERAVAELRIVA